MPFSTRLFSDTIRLNPFVSRDQYNNATYGSPKTLKCREESSLEYRRENFKELEIAHTVMYVYSPNYTPNIEDTVTVLSGEVYPILTVLSNRGGDGKVAFYTVVLGARR